MASKTKSSRKKEGGSSKDVNVTLSSTVAQWLLDKFQERNTTGTSYSLDTRSDLPWNDIIAKVTDMKQEIVDDNLPRRTKIVEELVSTEQKYVQSIAQVVQVTFECTASFRSGKSYRLTAVKS